MSTPTSTAVVPGYVKVEGRTKDVETEQQPAPEVVLYRREKPAPTDPAELAAFVQNLQLSAGIAVHAPAVAPKPDKARSMAAALEALAVLKKAFPDENVLLIY